MKTREVERPKATGGHAGPKLPRPPAPVYHDVVNDLGWLSRAPARRADMEGAADIEPLLLRAGEESPLPPDPPKAPPLPEPPRPVYPDTEEKDAKPDVEKRG